MRKRRAGRSVGAYEAKTRFPELLRDAENGTAYVIRRRGKDVAQLIPLEDRADAADWSELCGEFDRLRAQIRGKFDVKAMVREGRRK